MRKSDFDYTLPTELIAQCPLAERGASRLLVLDPAQPAPIDSEFKALPQWLRAGDLLVLNDTRVLPARLFGRKSSGGAVELLLERLIDAHNGWFHLRVSKKPAPGASIEVEGGLRLRVITREGALFHLRWQDPVGDLADALERIGHIPLPPYIEREDDGADRERYQTVYARERGSVAAPTAGLHFDQAMLERLREQGIEHCFVTLHVGAGTFQSLREESLDKVVLHREWCRVPPAVVAAIEAARARGGRVIAVGTTSTRTLESAAQDGVLRPYEGETQLFIAPGYRFRVIDGLITNFHLPQSSLLMLVAALAGRERVLAAYRHAVAQRYRFFSYGDACLVWPAVEDAA